MAGVVFLIVVPTANFEQELVDSRFLNKYICINYKVIKWKLMEDVTKKQNNREMSELFSKRIFMSATLLTLVKKQLNL